MAIVLNRRLTEKSGRTTKGDEAGSETFALVGQNVYRLFNKLKGRIYTDQRGPDAFAGGTEPRAESGAMGASVMGGVRRCMVHAGRSHEPVYKEEAG